MWIKLIAASFLVTSARTLQPGPHVCQHEERYKINETEYSLANNTIRSYKWCLQVPPRCSHFTYNLLNESKIVEVEKSRVVSKCCDGYVLDPTQTTCVAECKTCINGVCDPEGKCYCHPGYRGDFCEKECESIRWGRYCRYHCTCNRGICNPQNGHCYCPSGWTGLRCEMQCQDGYFGEDCRNSCDCGEFEVCNPEDGTCSPDYADDIIIPNTNKTPTLKKYHTFDITVKNNNDKSNVKNTTFINNYNNDTNSININSNLTKVIGISSNNSIGTETRNNVHKNEPEIKKLQLYILTTTPKPEESDNKQVDSNNIINKNLINETGDSVQQVTMIQKIPVETKKTSRDKIAQSDFSLQSKDDYQFENNGLTSSLNLAIIITVVIILIIASYAATKKIKLMMGNKRSKTVFKENPDSKVGIIQRTSIFHTPLPDPPSVELEDITYKPEIESNTFNLNVINPTPTMSFKNREYLDLFYDHPPSTGSYRAASIPEPPIPGHLDSKDNVDLFLEPTYDEIPGWALAQPPSALGDDVLYINTTIEKVTKF